MYKIAADIVVFLHFLWIGFVILGFPVFCYLNWAKWRLFHLAAVVLMIVMQVTRTICPLTHLEYFLKSEDTAKTVYPGAFIIKRLEELIYVEDMTLEKISCATMAYLVLILLSFWFRPLPKNKAPAAHG